MRRDRKQTILFVIILLVMGMGIGYAFLTTTLTIDGTSDIDSATWDVHFENVQVQSGSVTGSQVITPATISADGQTVSYHIKLNEPGDAYMFKVDVVNSGSLNAKIDNILFRINGVDATMAPEYLAQYVMLDGYNPLTISQLINPGETKTLISGIHYREDIEPGDLPTEDTSLTISFGLVYDQMVSSGYVYSYNSNALVGDSIVNKGTFYNDIQFATFDFGYNCSVRYKINNNYVESLEVAFLVDNVEYHHPFDVSYANFKSFLANTFGASNCSEVNQGVLGYSCNNSEIEAVVYEDGFIIIHEGCYGCEFISSTSYSCGYVCFG